MKLALTKLRNEVPRRTVRTAGVLWTIGYCSTLQNMFVPWSLPRISTWGQTEWTITFAKEITICKKFSMSGCIFDESKPKSKDELERVIILQLKVQSPLIRIEHQGRIPCMWGNLICRLSKGCGLPGNWSALGGLIEWLMQVWTLVYSTGALWAAPKQP